MDEVEIGVIGGTGVYDPKILKNTKEINIETPYGKPSDTFVLGELKGRRIAFVNRHGKGHTIPPHKVNSRANIWALKSLGVKYCIASASVGILAKRIKPGDFIILTDFIDFTNSIHTFNDKFEDKPIHVDMTEPYSSKLRKIFSKAAKIEKIKLVENAVYINTRGPRFETKAEIRAFRKFGADVVGMTVAPETVLSKEVGIEYSAVAVGTNYACGISKNILSIEEVSKMMEKKEKDLKRLFMRAVELIDV